MYILLQKSFFIVKVANDLHSVKFCDQFLLFTILGPSVSFDIDNLDRFLKYVLLGLLVITMSWFVVLFLPGLPAYSFPILLDVSSSSNQYQMFEWYLSSLYLNHDLILSHTFKCHLYADELNLYFQLLPFF